MRSEPICLRVKGPFACFTRPEFHVERVSYPVITPSAARGILEAILMKPVEKPEEAKRHNKVGFRWVITRLGVINKGTTLSILRNELRYPAHQKPEDAIGYDINADRMRAQRHSLILSGGTDGHGNRQMLDYLIEAVIEVRPEDGSVVTGKPARAPTSLLVTNTIRCFCAALAPGNVSISRFSVAVNSRWQSGIWSKHLTARTGKATLAGISRMENLRPCSGSMRISE